MKSNFYFASCPMELEELLYKELVDIGIEEPRKTRGGVIFKTDMERSLKALVNSRIASRVFYEWVRGQIKNEKGLYKWAKTVEWSKLMDVDQTFKIDVLLDGSAKSYFRNTLYLSQVIKDAIVDQFKEDTGKRPSVDVKNPDITFLARIEGKAPYRVTLSVDMSGSPLSNRGYRAPGHSAPLRENLAAAIVLSTGWNPKEEKFVDIMCGSGTLVLEAAMIAADLPPSYLKIRNYIEKGHYPFSLIGHKWFKAKSESSRWFEDYLQDIYNESLEKLNALPNDLIYASDINMKALQIAIKSAQLARLAPYINFDKADATDSKPPVSGKNIIICNPPYGERMGEEDELSDLYHQVGENLKSNFKGNLAFIFTGNPELRKKISLQTSARITFFNGPIECRLLRYELY